MTKGRKPRSTIERHDAALKCVTVSTLRSTISTVSESQSRFRQNWPQNPHEQDTSSLREQTRTKRNALQDIWHQTRHPPALRCRHLSGTASQLCGYKPPPKFAVKPCRAHLLRFVAKSHHDQAFGGRYKYSPPKCSIG